jgi:hypothetical protein
MLPPIPRLKPGISEEHVPTNLDSIHSLNLALAEFGILNSNLNHRRSKTFALPEIFLYLFGSDQYLCNYPKRP